MIRYVNEMMGNNETILLRSRRHWFALIRLTVVELILIFGIIVIATLASIANPLMAWTFLLLLIPVATFIKDLLVHLNHIYVITNRRVIQFSGVLNKNVIDSSIEKVNDIRLEQSFFGRVFGYGDIEILTANEIAENKFKMIAGPMLFKTTLLNAREMVGMDAENGSSNMGRSIPQMIKELDALRQQNIITQMEFDQKKAELLQKLK